MTMLVRSPVLFFSALFGVVLTVAAAAGAADQPVRLGVEGYWAAYSRQTPEGKVCYALSEPVATLPQNARRGKIRFLINDWPSRQVKSEMQVVSGYPFKKGVPVTVSVGSLSVDFFSQNDGGDGFAWVRDRGNDAALIDAMRRGARMIVEGRSSRGTKTKDTYSLKGISAALDKIHQACGM